MSFREFKPEEWSEEIELGLDYRRKFGIEGVWGELEALFYNVHPSQANDGPNVIMSTGDSLLSSLSVPAPRVIVKPRRSEAVGKSPLLEALDNLFIEELNLREEVDTVQLHTFLFGTGILKVGYDSEYGFDPKLDVGGPLKLGFTFSQLEQKGRARIEHDAGVSPGMPWVKAVSPNDIVVPWGTVRLSNCPWIAHRFVRQIDDLKADPKYSNTDRLVPTLSMENFYDSYKSAIRLWRPNASASSRDATRRSKKPSTRNRGDREIQFVELYEIHDRRTGKIFVVAPDVDKFLRNDINALQIQNRLPFIGTSFTPRARSFWTTSDAYYLRASQMELSDLAVQRTKQRRISVLKFLYDEGVILDEELQKILSTDVGAAAKIEAGSDITKAIMPIQSPLDQSMVLEEEHLRRNVREQIGMSRNQLGEFSGGRRTATEANIVDSASALRMSRRGLTIKRLFEETIETVNGIVFEHWTAPRYIEVMGQDNSSLWESITGPGLKSRYAYEVIFTTADAERARKMEALQLYSLMVQDPAVDPVALRMYMADQFNDPQFARIFNADVQNAMRLMRIGERMVAAEGSPGGSQGGGTAPVSPVQQNNGTRGRSAQSPSVARGGSDS
jgi:hypothetical protein